MGPEEYIKLVKKALAKQQFKQLLRGEGEYNCEMDMFGGGPAPTNWPALLEHGIYGLAKQDPESEVDEVFEKTLIDLCAGDCYDIYCGMMLFFMQVIWEDDDAAGFWINREKVRRAVVKALRENREELTAYKEWRGKDYPDGLWGEARRIDKILKEDYGITILPD